MTSSDIPDAEALDNKARKQALANVRALADKWHNAIELGTGNPSIISRAFADELYRALDGW
ncbi:hypothetical protein [Mycobacterium phage WXIN]|nr:hypothetical protein [Mycobacterium phage WXIN]